MTAPRDFSGIPPDQIEREFAHVKQVIYAALRACGCPACRGEADEMVRQGDVPETAA